MGLARPLTRDQQKEEKNHNGYMKNEVKGIMDKIKDAEAKDITWQAIGKVN